MLTEKSKRGGAREGAGRKPIGRKAYTVRATEEEWVKIQEFIKKIKKDNKDNK